jgi:hypothetical protein
MCGVLLSRIQRSERHGEVERDVEAKAQVGKVRA